MCEFLVHYGLFFAEVDAFGTPVPNSVAIPAIPQARFFDQIQFVSHRFAKLKPGSILITFGYDSPEQLKSSDV